MSIKKVGFIGAGRVTRILLTGWARSRSLPASCFVSDTDPEVLERLRYTFPFITPVPGENGRATSQDLVFGALHPPAMKQELPRLRAHLRPGAVFVSLAPKLTTEALSEALGGFDRIVRLIPNAPSIVGAGFNPVTFSAAVPVEEKLELLELFAGLGDCPEVAEEALEAYAVVAAMGPTYLWFQLAELARLGVEFGLGRDASRRAVQAMTEGAVKTLFQSGLTPEEVMDLVPVKPLLSEEEAWRSTYRSTLTALHEKLAPRPQPALV